MVIYLPVTADILTVGHVRIMKSLARKGELIVGLLDEEALSGYKTTVMSFAERKEILESVKWIDKVVKQNSLNPYDNLVKYKVTHVASGDGFEKEELEAIEKARCKELNIKLDGEKNGRKLYSSSKIKSSLRKEANYA